MPVSRKCEQCWTVKRCSAYPVDREDSQAALVYLCRPCARDLGYAPSGATLAHAAGPR